MIGIICALEIELDALKSQLQEPEKACYSGIDYFAGKLAGQHAVLAQCGVGKVNAALCAQTMALVYRPELMINSGVAGGLTAALHPGDIAIGRDVVQHDVDTSALGDPVGMVSTVNVTYFPCDAAASQQILAVAQKCLNVRARLARIASGEQFVASSERKSEIIRLFQAEACEMEAGAIAQVCYINRIPFAAIRAISDSADECGEMDYGTFLPLAARNSSELVMKFLETR